MSLLRLQMHDDAVLLYSLHADGAQIGEVRPHAPHADILRIGTQAWWLADDVGTALDAAGASLARRIVSHAVQPRSYSLRADGGEPVLARAQRRWRWSAREDGLACEVGGTPYRVRSLGAFGGRFALEDGGGRALAELALTGFGRGIQTERLPLPQAQGAFLLYATHRSFGRDVRASGGGE